MRLLVSLFGLAFALTLPADTPRVWEEQGYDDLDKGTLHRLSLRSDGKLMLAPRFRKVSDPAMTYVWALAEDSRGNLYVGGGSPAKVVRVALGRSPGDAEIKPETVFESKELEIHALAVDGDDNLYAATSPDPKVYKIGRDGKSSVFFEPKQAKYVWAMAFDPTGHLLVATGDKGELYRVDRKGEGKLFFNSDETHVRSIAVDKAGNVIIGTDPSGLVLRISPAGEGFVLYQTAKKEVTAVEVGPDGSIYAAAVGDKQPRQVMPAAALPPPPPVVAGPPSPAVPSIPPVAGGTEVYRIFPDGSPLRLWASKEDVVYALALRGERLLLGSGNKGRVFELEPGGLYTSLLKAQSSQVTSFLRRRNGELFAAASNIGRLHEISDRFEADGIYESEVFDARNFARWGRVFWSAEAPAGSSVKLFTRSGNADNPDRNWSPWAPVGGPNAARGNSEPSASPGARFLQWKAVLAATDGKSTPWLDTVKIAYFPKNVKPAVEEVQATPPGYRFQPSVTQPGQPLPPITLPPLGLSRTSQPGGMPRFDPPAQLLAQKGAQGVRWAARDDNDDLLMFSVHIRGKEERTWKLLKDKLTDKFYSWDSTAFPDGIYYVKVVASDSPSNSEQDALTDERPSAPFEVDNTPPQITGLKATPEGGRLRIAFRAADALSPIKKAEYSLNGSDWRLVLPVDQLSDSLEEDYSFVAAGSGAGEQTIAVRVQDRIDNLAVEKTIVK